MNKLLVALIAGVFATAAAAQTAAPAPAAPAAPAKATAKEKAATVDATTKAAVAADNPIGSPPVSKAAKDAPKALPTKADKQKAVDTTTAAGVDTSQGDAAKAKATVDATKKDPKAAKPNLKDPAVEKAMQKAATP
jgi:hypothetical protein